MHKLYKILVGTAAGMVVLVGLIVAGLAVTAAWRYISYRAAFEQCYPKRETGYIGQNLFRQGDAAVALCMEDKGF